VAAGQFLHYSYDMTASGNDIEMITNIPQGLLWLNHTVLSVSGVNVTFQQIYYNSTASRLFTWIQDIENGQVNGSANVPFFVAANLSAGDPFYIGAGISINETVAAVYLGQQLETNHMIVRTNVTNMGFYGYMVNCTLAGHLYWERKTGIMLDYDIEQDSSRPDGAVGVLTAHWHIRILILSAVPPPPVIPEFPSLLALPMFMSTTLLAMVFYRRKHKED
jgi:hypothetical protein